MKIILSFPRRRESSTSDSEHTGLRRADARRWISAFAGMTILFGCLSFPAQASDIPAIDPALCNALVNATPDADVAYQPGVDVDGNAVAPADLPGPKQIKLPSKFQIPLTINLAKSLNLNTSSYPYNQLGTGTEATLGVLTVEGNKVSFNGQSLSDDQQDKLAVLCMQPR